MTPESLVLLYQDDAFVAIDKPSGLLVHRTYLDRHEKITAMQLLADRLGRPVYPAHRLDKSASGILLFALSPDAARQMGAQFAEKSVGKRYLALVRGHPEDAGRIDYPLKQIRDKRFQAPRDASTPPQPALTRYRTLSRTEQPFAISRYPTSRYALVEAETETGRYHQVRRHLDHIHHPIIGDQKHGDYRHNRYFREQLGCSRLLLHAARMSVEQPLTGQPLTLEAALPDDFRAVMDRLGLTQ
jgi:tRNA pseudouridine65 synthase